MLDWCISGVAFSDSMDLRVAGQLDILGNVYTALGWKEAVHTTVRALSKVMLVCKEGQVSDLEVWAMKRAKKFWSQEVTVENSLTLNPTLQTFVSQAKQLEQCVRAADFAEKGYL